MVEGVILDVQANAGLSSTHKAALEGVKQKLTDAAVVDKTLQKNIIALNEGLVSVLSTTAVSVSGLACLPVCLVRRGLHNSKIPYDPNS